MRSAHLLQVSTVCNSPLFLIRILRIHVDVPDIFHNVRVAEHGIKRKEMAFAHLLVDAEIRRGFEVPLCPI